MAALGSRRSARCAGPCPSPGRPARAPRYGSSTWSPAAPATVVTSWHARRSSKHTHLRLADGARVLIDHTAGSGLLVAGGAVAEQFAPADDGLASMVSHYVAVYRDWLAEPAASDERLAAGRELLRRVDDAQELLEPGA